MPLPGADARDRDQRDIAKFLREQHLPGVDTDDDASVVLEVEQARLTLLASAGVIAFEITQLLASKRMICVTPLYWSLALLCIAIGGAWLGLVWAEHIRRFRVDRRYTIYHGELSAYLRLTPEEKVSIYDSDAVWSDQLRKEGTTRSRFRNYRYAVATLTAAGIVCGVLSAIGTADITRCHFELLKPQADLK